MPSVRKKNSHGSLSLQAYESFELDDPNISPDCTVWPRPNRHHVIGSEAKAKEALKRIKYLHTATRVKCITLGRQLDRLAINFSSFRSD